MARIPDDEIDRIKRETDLLALVRSRGIALEKHGSKDWKGLCPFHKDTENPNFIVSPEVGLFHCMACGKAGNPIQFVQHHDGISFRHAYELLATGGKEAYLAKPQAKNTTIPLLPCPLDPEADDATLLSQVTAYYHDRLKHHNPAAREYLASRGLDSEELIEKYQLGVADRTLGLRLPDANRKAGEKLRSRLTQLGVWRDNGREHFNGCIVIPLQDRGGTVVSYYGRRIGKAQRGAVEHLYSPGPHQGLFNPKAFDHEEVILCEAVLDALTFCANGFSNASCIYGTEGWTEEHTAALKRVKRVKLAYDADEAGSRAAERDTARLLALGIEVYRIKFPWGMDANEYASKVTPAGKSLALLINAAEWKGFGKAPRILTNKGSALDRFQENSEEPPTPKAQPQKSEVAATPPLPPVPEPSIAPAPSSSSSLAASVSCSEDGERAAKKESEVAPVVTVTPTAPAEQRLETPPLPPCLETPPPVVQSPSPASQNPPPLPQTPSPLKLVSSWEKKGEAWHLTLEGREYRVTGIEKTVKADHLKVGLRVQVERAGSTFFHLDQVDLMRDIERRKFIERAAEETGLTPELLKRDLGRLLLSVEQAQIELLKPVEAAPGITLTIEEREEALRWLREPHLIERLKEAFHLAGIIGEETNTLVAYLAGVSRKLERPLAIIIQSASAAGKSTLMDAVLSFFPEEDRIKYSAMTGQSLYYLGETNLKHKILAIVEEAGAEKASYALKLLQSEGEITIASTGKDPQTGRMVTQVYRVEGPVMIFLTTTSIDIDEELQNRALVLTVNESREQTERIHQFQRERRTLAGLIAKEHKKEILTKLKNAQRLLEPVPILNHYAPDLTFPSGRTRNRRDHEKYLTLIDSITLLHQHQRPRGQYTVGGRTVDYVPVTFEDIALANQLAPEILGRSLDELPPQTRRLLDYIRELVRGRGDAAGISKDGGGATFTRKELREKCGWSVTQVRVHLDRLVELEYLYLRTGRMGGPFEYELALEMNGSTEASVTLAHIGLIDVNELRKAYQNKPLPYTYNPNNESSVTLVAGFSGQVAEKVAPLTEGDETAPSPQLSSEKAA